MKLAHRLLHLRLLLVIALVLGVMVGSVPSSAQTGIVTSTATPSDDMPEIGDTITVTITINMTGVAAPDNYLGGYTGSIAWDPAILEYVSNTGLPAGFTGNVNTANAGSGEIIFNGVNISGATGNIVILTINFDVVGAGSSDLDLGYSAMAAATTFHSLLGILTVNDGSVTVGGASHTVTFNANGGTGTMSPQTASVPTALTLNTFTRTGYTFSGWNTAGNGTGTAYPDGATYSFAADITLYAQWNAVSDSVISSATPSNAAPTVGQQVVVTINIDMTGAAGVALGSYTGSIAWNSTILTYVSYSGAPPTDFTGVVNVTNADAGSITFNGANAAGATGDIDVLVITFDVVGTGTTALDLDYSAMAGIGQTFPNLLPILTVNDGSVTVGAANHTVTFNANGGSGSMSPQTANVPTALTPNTFTRTGYAFSGWNTVANGTGTAYADGATYSFAADITLHAQWSLVGGSVTSSATPSNATPAVGDQIVVTINIDMTGAAGVALGSFTGTLDWNPAVLTYVSNTGLPAGFTGNVNTANAGSGEIIFNGVNTSGATGNIIALTITFDAVGAGTTALDLDYSAMAAASTFTGLLPILTTNDSQVTVSAVVQYTLTVAVDPVGSGTTNPAVGTYTYPDGTFVDITATPAAHYAFDHWSGACSGTGECQVVMDADKTVTAHFVEITYDLTVVVDPVGSGTTNPAVGVHTYAEGTAVNVTATAATGYTFDHWSGACSGTGTCSVTMDADKTVTAHFTGITYGLTVAVDPAGSGTTNPAVGVHAYAHGIVVDITATPAAGYAFDHWSGACTGTGACSVTMDGDKVVIAHFVVVTHDLTVTVDPAGGGTTDPAAGVHTYAEGAVVSITSTPAAGYVFDHWSGACTGTGSCSVTMDANRAVTAHFEVVVFRYFLPVLLH